MRAKFRKMLVDVLMAPNTGIYSAMWKSYKENVRGILPEDVPSKVQKQVRELKQIIEGKLDERIKGYCEKSERDPATKRYRMVKDPNKDENIVRRQIESGQLQWVIGNVLGGMSHSTANKIKKNLLQIVENYPKREPKSKLHAPVTKRA